MSLLELIKQRISKNGPMSVADYMSLCLSHPEYGYYMRADPLGAAGDFITAPEISQIFGEMVGLWLARQWQRMGAPNAALVEMGPGRGTLMADALRATKYIPGFHEAITVHLIEISPALKQKQWQILAEKHPALSWHQECSQLPPKPLLLIANEFFDALPIRQFSGNGERMIDAKDDHLEFVIASVAKQSSLNCHVADAPRNDVVETCEPAIVIMKQVSDHIAKHRGAALIIDYGYAHGSKGDTFQAMKNHAYHDPLIEPGSADLTAHVDFAALKKTALEASVQAYGPIPQGDFLKRMGAEMRLQALCKNAAPEQKSLLISGLERLMSIDRMGDLFKCLALSDSPQTPEGF